MKTARQLPGCNAQFIETTSLKKAMGGSDANPRESDIKEQGYDGMAPKAWWVGQVTACARGVVADRNKRSQTIKIAPSWWENVAEAVTGEL
jgi:hypothetical protein